MSAAPLIPGRLYRVQAPRLGIAVQVAARHGCDAICIAVGLLQILEG